MPVSMVPFVVGSRPCSPPPVAPRRGLGLRLGFAFAFGFVGGRVVVVVVGGVTVSLCL